MINIEKKKNIYTFFLVFFIFIFYFFGFYYREITNGAGHSDLQYHIWLLVNDFDTDFIGTLKNYISYKEATFPFFHIIQAKLNPFKTSVIAYCLFNTILNLLILLLFYFFLKKKEIFKESQSSSIILIVFIILLSPWFRSSSYWGMTENFALFFLIPSLYYFSKLCEGTDNDKSNILLTIFICFTLYSRQQYLFLPLAHLLILLTDKNYRKFLFSSLIYLLIASPGLYIFYIWGVFENLSSATSGSEIMSKENIFLNIPKISTLFLFYLLPVIFLNFQTYLKIFISKKFFYIFIIIFFIEYLLFNKIQYPDMGGGYIIKFNRFFLDNNIILILLLSSLFFSIVTFSRMLNYRYFIVLILIFVVIGLPKFVYQEWFDPIYIMIYYLLLPKSAILESNLNKTRSIYFLIVWEFSILIIALVYYHYYLKLPFFYSF